MDDLNLNNDEAIIQTTQTIIISGVRHEAVLTSRRLILVASETGHIHENIPFADITLAASGINRIREPIITLSFNSPEGEKRTLDLIFIRLAEGQNIKDLERCLTILKQYNVPVEGKVQLADAVRMDRDGRADTGVLAVDETISRPAVPDWSSMGSSNRVKKPLKGELPERSPLFLIGAVILIIVVVVSGAVIVGQLMNAKNMPVNQSVTGTDIANDVVVSPTPASVPTPQPEVPSVTESSPRAITVPTDGIWVKISYPGNYSGYLGAQGKQIEVNSSGTQFYNLPVQDAMIEGMIEKQDGSADTLEVGVYNGGALVSKSETKTPRGVVDIHVMVGTAIGGVVIPTPLPVVKAEPTPDASLPRITIPATGVWVRISYPGNFTGYIGAKGRLETANSTGNLLIHLPVTSGMIDGSIEKQDGTSRTMIIEIYKDGTPVFHSATSRPFDLVDIHTNV